jgi:hypothetical protein
VAGYFEHSNKLSNSIKDGEVLKFHSDPVSQGLCSVKSVIRNKSGNCATGYFRRVDLWQIQTVPTHINCCEGISQNINDIV